ncbi:MAG: aminotransferase-like domain-containing protein [Chloroflexota bacterium]
MSSLRPVAFTRGVPPVESFPVEEVADCAAAILKADPNILLQYGKAAGYQPLRELVAEQNGVTLGQVFLSNGSLQLMEFLSTVLLRPGDVALVESPSYDRAITTFRHHQAQVVGVPLEADGVNIAALESAAASQHPKVFYVISDFQNPAGVTTSAAKRRAIGELAERYGFWIIEDVPYRRLRYYGEEQPTILSLAPARTLQLSSFSKLLSPGLRTGFLLGPTAVVNEVAKVAEDAYISPALPTEGIVYEYCRRGLLEQNIERLRSLYRPKLDATLAALERELPGASYAKPEGGYFVGVTMPEGLTGADLMAAAARVNLTLTDGDGFFTTPPSRTFVRIPFCSLSTADIAEGIGRLGQIVKTGV